MLGLRSLVVSSLSKRNHRGGLRASTSTRQSWRRSTHRDNHQSSKITTTSKTKTPRNDATYNHSSPTEAVLEEGGDLFFGTHLYRLAGAFGFVYVITEYGVELTICEGPSMLPTIQSKGEIVVMDRWTPRWHGLQGGTVGEERAKSARERQQAHELRLQSSTRIDVPAALTSTPTWYRPMIPINQIPPTGAWGRFWNRLSTGISVGDVVVLQHPDRVGTVCKRVLGLPGDVVTKPSRRNVGTRRLRKRKSGGGLIIPDGQIWVEGDNPWNSSDSRNYGSVPAALIVGRVLFRVWPLRGNAMMERGARPVDTSPSEKPQLTFSGSVVVPAGYEDQMIVRSYDEMIDQKCI